MCRVLDTHASGANRVTVAWHTGVRVMVITLHRSEVTIHTQLTVHTHCVMLYTEQAITSDTEHLIIEISNAMSTVLNSRSSRYDYLNKSNYYHLAVDTHSTALVFAFRIQTEFLSRDSFIVYTLVSVSKAVARYTNTQNIAFLSTRTIRAQFSILIVLATNLRSWSVHRTCQVAMVAG